MDHKLFFITLNDVLQKKIVNDVLLSLFCFFFFYKKTCTLPRFDFKYQLSISLKGAFQKEEEGEGSEPRWVGLYVAEQIL